MKRFAALALAASIAPAAARADPVYPVNPGYWEVTTNWLGLVTTTARYCVAPRNITKFMSAPCNHIYHCSYPIQEYGNGKARFDGYIRGRDELYHVVGGGTYSLTTMDMHVTGSGHWHIVPISDAHASLKGHWLGADCPADAKRFK